MDELLVVMNDAVIGHLRRADALDVEFEYAHEWAGTPLSLSLPVGQNTYKHGVLSPYLWGLLPDNESVVRRWARNAEISANDIMGLLAAVGHDVAGAVQFVRPDKLATVGRRRTTWLTNAEVGALVSEVSRDTAGWHGDVGGKRPGSWSLAGAQGKIALTYDAENGWGVPHGRAATTHILKPAIGGLTDHDLNEHLCLSVAAKLGLVAAESQVADFDGVRTLVVRRYDRSVGRLATRVHQEDMCQALGVHPALKYQADGGPSALDIARLLGEASSAPTQDMQSFVSALIFNWAIMGTDAHAKNYSVLLDGATVRLAPLYDLGTVLPYGDHPKKCRLAMKIDGTYRPTDLTALKWRRFAREIGVDDDRLVDTARLMCGRIADSFRDAAADLDRPGTGAIVDAVADWSTYCAARFR